MIFTEKSVSKNTSKFSHSRTSSSSELANDELTELVARTGHTKGWSTEDHSLFLRVRKRLDPVPQLVVELRRKLPHLTNEEIVNHEAWYKLYTELRDKRKREIAEWRTKRVPSAEVTGSEKGLRTRTRLGEKEKKEAENKKIEKKRMIEHWKAEKARKSAMDDEQRKKLERAKIDLEKRRMKNYRSQARVRLKEIREEKIEKSAECEPIPRKDLKSCDSMPRLMKAFREQDEKFVRKRLSLLKMQGFGKEESRKSSVTKPREYSTLFKATKSWEEKCKTENNPEASIFGRVNYVKDIQKLSSASGQRKEDSSIMKNV